MLQDQITQYTAEINSFETTNADELEQFRIRFLGTKGIIKDIFDQFKAVSPEEKRTLGKVLNEFKQLAEAKYQSLNEVTANSQQSTNNSQLDLTLPGEGFEVGARHPLALVRREIIEIFNKLGFSVAEGPEIEDDWHNFSALNFPEEHPARDMQDTFFIKKGGEKGDIALRTHTSSVQVRMMEAGQPPFRALMPGRVYRNEAISARAHCFFHQVEGLYVDENVSFADLNKPCSILYKNFMEKEQKFVSALLISLLQNPQQKWTFLVQFAKVMVAKCANIVDGLRF
jgi:phenylalanyl-tRNA synthetase alpha chain